MGWGAVSGCLLAGIVIVSAGTLRGATRAEVSIDALASLPEGFHSDVDGTSMALGTHHTCALEYRPGIEIGGAIRCWGRNEWGESSPPGELFIQVSAGDTHTCGVKVDQGISCWGASEQAPEGLYQQVSVGSHHSCALSLDGQAICWGDNGYGAITDTPTHKEFVQLSCGDYYCCGLRRSGKAECWGKNTRGQCDVPEGAQFRQPSAKNSYGNNPLYSLGLLGRQLVFTDCDTITQLDTKEQLKQSSKNHNNSPTLITKLLPCAIRQLSASVSDHTCGVTLTGDMMCWGRNIKGEAEDRPGPWKQVSCGQWRTCGIKEASGGLECWGMRASEVQGGDHQYEEVTTRSHHTCAVDVEGNMRCWGSSAGSEKVPEGFQLA
ncbi:unnamed protein product [Chrysoparadoxa australica]